MCASSVLRHSDFSSHYAPHTTEWKAADKLAECVTPTCHGHAYSLSQESPWPMLRHPGTLKQ